MTAKMASRWLRVSETTLFVLAFLLPLAFYLKAYDGATIKTTLFEAGTAVLAFTRASGSRPGVISAAVQRTDR